MVLTEMTPAGTQVSVDELLNARCNQCKRKLDGRSARELHRDLLLHDWQPAYECRGCKRVFKKKRTYYAHVHACPAHTQRKAQALLGSGSLPATTRFAQPLKLQAPSHPPSMSDAYVPEGTTLPSQESYAHDGSGTRQAPVDEDIPVASAQCVSATATEPPGSAISVIEAVLSTLSTALSLVNSVPRSAVPPHFGEQRTLSLCAHLRT
ncbi:hypothetical protein BD413DRAFT_1874 [Trametes elegans]|nr:hypothetical protein BD413DRAFT_1874 [Trametes elegans]